MRSRKDMTAKLQQELEEIGWSLRDPNDPFGPLVCPHGHAVEPDGKCPEGCVSPLRETGLI